MRLRWLAARVIALAVLASPAAALAADLDDDAGAPHGRAGYDSPYDDPRYRDIYRLPDPPAPRYAEPIERRYAEPPYREPPPPPYRSRGSSKDDGYLEPMPAPPRFAPPRPRYAERPGECLTRHEIRTRLRDDGFSDFHDIEPRGRSVLVTARRPSGHLFDLEVDRCTGDILSARRLESDRGRPYAYEPPPVRRYYRTY